MTYPLPIRECVQGSTMTERTFQGDTLYLGGYREVDVGNPNPAGPEHGHGSLPTSPSESRAGHRPMAQAATQADGALPAWSHL